MALKTMVRKAMIFSSTIEIYWVCIHQAMESTNSAPHRNNSSTHGFSSLRRLPYVSFAASETFASGDEHGEVEAARLLLTVPISPMLSLTRLFSDSSNAV